MAESDGVNPIAFREDAVRSLSEDALPLTVKECFIDIFSRCSCSRGRICSLTSFHILGSLSREQMTRFAAKRRSRVRNHHEWYIFMKPSRSRTEYAAGAMVSPKSFTRIFIFFSG